MTKFAKFIFLSFAFTLSFFGPGNNAKGQCLTMFTWSVSGDTVNFTNTSIPTNPGYFSYWSFGDGNSSYSFNSSHIYNIAGSYIVCLTYGDSLGCFDTYCDTINAPGANGGGGCDAAYSYYVYPDSMNPAVLTNMVQFTDQSTGGATNWFWDFGDGTTSTQQSPFHTFPGPGNYNVCLIIQVMQMLNVICSDTTCTTITVGGQNTCGAYFTFTQDTLGNVTFTDGSTYLGTPNYWWDFGDGSYSTLQNPNHNYASGTYYACLTISDSLNGCYSTWCQSLTVYNANTPCVADFIAFPDSNVVMNGNTYFYDLSTGNITNWLWDFGDGTTDTVQNPIHQYLLPGTYWVCLVVWTPATQCSTQYCDLVNVPLAMSNEEAMYSISGLKIFPNPANEMISIAYHSEIASIHQITVRDLQGRVVYVAATGLQSAGDRVEKLNVQQFKPGLYFLSISSGENSTTAKMMVAKND